MPPRYSSPSGSSSSDSTISNSSTILIFVDDDPKALADLKFDLDLDEEPMLDDMDEDVLPPPFPGFDRRDEKGKGVDKGNGGGVKIVLNTHPRRQQFVSPTPSPPNMPSLHRQSPINNRFLLTSPSHHRLPTRQNLKSKSQSPSNSRLFPLPPPKYNNLHPILCCDLARPRYKPNPSSSNIDSLTHLINLITTPLISHFLDFGQETGYGREFGTTSTLGSGRGSGEQKFVVVLQRVHYVKNERHYVSEKCRWFVPVMSGDNTTTSMKINRDEIMDSEEDCDTDTDTDMEINAIHSKRIATQRTIIAKAKPMEEEKTSHVRENTEGLLPVSHSINAHLAAMEEKLTGKLMELEEGLDEEVDTLSRLQRALMPKFARTDLDQADEGEEWQDGQLGFKEWFPSGEREMVKGEGEGDAVDVLNDYLPVEGRAGKMEVRCWECERDWVLTIREKVMML
ncbi:uncharacterized protein RSE6_11388 [Rhynchosporium secalis]|uniref:Uncharacterized protein n=1 Tax=Rhynchosporium secalis TaxID=38038 RepID=A0A1E1MMU8_RHYSE|nr:uncharacterized protein RSE6_11388 [Rhynchosporium secalis]